MIPAEDVHLEADVDLVGVDDADGSAPDILGYINGKDGLGGCDS